MPLPSRWRVLARYLGAALALHLAWETLQFPLYTLWRTGTRGEIVWALAHCTVGDVLIAAGTLALGVTLTRARGWPAAPHYARVARLATLLGIAYTVYSEWQQVSVRGSWSYTAAMPLVPPLGTGLAPLLQWLAVPPLSFWWARPVEMHGTEGAEDDIEQ